MYIYLSVLGSIALSARPTAVVMATKPFSSSMIVSWRLRRVYSTSMAWFIVRLLSNLSVDRRTSRSCRWRLWSCCMWAEHDVSPTGMRVKHKTRYTGLIHYSKVLSQNHYLYIMIICDRFQTSNTTGSYNLNHTNKIEFKNGQIKKSYPHYITTTNVL